MVKVARPAWLHDRSPINCPTVLVSIVSINFFRRDLNKWQHFNYVFHVGETDDLHAAAAYWLADELTISFPNRSRLMSC